jgi:hypothetical protein
MKCAGLFCLRLLKKFFFKPALKGGMGNQIPEPLFLLLKKNYECRRKHKENTTGG